MFLSDQKESSTKKNSDSDGTEMCGLSVWKNRPMYRILHGPAVKGDESKR